MPYFVTPTTKQSVLAIPFKQDQVTKLYELVRNWILNVKPYEDQIKYFTKPDERTDLTDIALRVYGDRREFIAVLACANLDSVDVSDTQLIERELIMPPLNVLIALKQRAGYITDDSLRR